MNYFDAAKARKKGLANLITDRLVSGQSVGSSIGQSISERMSATAKGFKEKFNLLNIAKTLTGGSNLAPALLGKMMGRKAEDISYFAGRKDPNEARGASNFEPVSNKSITILNDMLSFMKKTSELEQIDFEISNLRNQEETQRKDTQHKEVMDVFIKATEAKRKAQQVLKSETEKFKPEEKVALKPPPEPTLKPPTEPTPTPIEPVLGPKVPAILKPTPKVEPAAPATKVPAILRAPSKVEPPAPVAVSKVPAILKPATKISPVIKSTAKKIPALLTGNKGLVLSSLAAAGYSTAAQANILANVEKESGFVPRSEQTMSAKTLFKFYGPVGVEGGQPPGGKNKVRFPNLLAAEELVSKGPAAVAEVVYGGRMGNTQPGDAYKYRGRGFIQITGKDAYDKIGKLIGVDLLNNPDLANDPEIAAKIVPEFFKYKGLKTPQDLEDIRKVNKLVGSASEQSKKEREQLSMSYLSELKTGETIAAQSKQNADLKSTLGGGTAVGIAINNTTNNVVQEATKPNTQAQKTTNPTLERR